MKPGALFLTVALTACGSVLPQQHAPSAFGTSNTAPRGVSCRGQAPNAADPTAVHGLMVWIDSTHLTTADPEILKYLPYDPKLCGASIDFLWSGIDKGPNASKQYVWKIVEDAIAPWVAAGKRANLLFIGANEAGTADTATPSYVLTGPSPVPTVPACTSPGPGINAGPPTPIYWNPRYKGPWRAFIAAVIKRYGKDSRIGYMRFGLGAGAEDFPQHGADGTCFAAWRKHGLTGAHYWAKFSADLARYIGRTSRKNNSTVQQTVALNPFADTASPYPVAGTVAAAAAAVGVGFGTENLGSGDYGSTPEPCTNAQYWCAAFNAHAGKVPEEFQPIDFTLDPKIEIAPLTSLLPYAMLNHAQIFELYPEEWLTADDPQFPTYCHYHRAWQRTLSQAADILGRSGTNASPSPSPSPCSPPLLRRLPSNLRGITYDDVSSRCGTTGAQLRTERMLHGPAIRVVFDRVVPRCYASAVGSLDRYGYTMGELIDSSSMKKYSLPQVRSRVTSYLQSLGSSVDLWEIGNEVNGEWLSSVECPQRRECAAQAHDVVAKVGAMYDAVRSAGYRTALTLYYQPPQTVTSGYDMLSWERAYVPHAMHAGLDYVFVSYYETDNRNIRPPPAQWDAIFRSLAADFPNARIGFGEIGMNRPIAARTLRRASGIFNYYQTLAFPDVPSYTRAGFWWNGAEDLVPPTKWPSFFRDVSARL